MPEGLEVSAAFLLLIGAACVIIMCAAKLRCHLQTDFGREGLVLFSYPDITGFGVHEHVLVVGIATFDKVLLKVVVRVGAKSDVTLEGKEAFGVGDVPIVG